MNYPEKRDGTISDQATGLDWHGSGAQRSSIKTLDGQALTDEDLYSINACDVDRPDNLDRCVRNSK